MTGASTSLREALEGAVQLAIQRHQAGDLAAAQALYGKVLSADARHPVALHNLGLIRLGQGDAAAALVLLESAVNEKPQEPVFQFNLGLARQSAGDIAGAADSYRMAVQLKADYRKAWENLGVVLQDLEQFDEAAKAYRRALVIDPAAPVAHKNLGNVLRTVGRLDAAEAQYQQALEFNPLDTEIGLQAAGMRLSRGDFSAWPRYEWRYWAAESLQANEPFHVPLPKWDGGSLVGKGVLLYGEQGVGDEIMFASCVPDVAARAARTHLLCDARLVPLFARSFPQVAVAAKQRGNLPPWLAPQGPCELRTSLASLPQHLRKSEAAFPGAPYLKADAMATAQWREQLRAPGVDLVVGLSWRGGAAARAREARSIDLARLAPLFADTRIRFVNLQYGDHHDEIERFNGGSGNPLMCLEGVDALRDMDGFAALIAALDCVISVDNSTVHLAGALGTPTWLLLPYHADWRWIRERQDSPWYGSLRLIWQDEPGRDAWTGVIARALDLLATLAARDIPAAAPAVTPSTTGSALAAAADVLLLNDTTYWYHWGCSCTSNALHEELRARGLVVDPVAIREINALAPLPGNADELDSDAVFEAFCANHAALVTRMRAVSIVLVNGEGSIHDLGQTARALLYLAYIAKQRLGKQVRIVNHSAYPVSDGSRSAAVEEFYRRVYAAMDHVAVREAHSAALLAELGINAVQSFDCLPLFAARHPPSLNLPTPQGGQRKVVLAGSVAISQELVQLLTAAADAAIRQGCSVEVLVGANAYLAHDDVLLLGALQQTLRGRYTLVAASSEQQWLQTIASAELLISGRFHHSIAAACLGTPFLVTASNTTKIAGLLDRLGLTPDQAWIAPTNVAGAVSRIEALLQQPRTALVAAETLQSLRELALRNFDGLPAPTARD